ncbi:MAG: endonuclease/exonuclease/phosphatase family protein [Clostridia bacterium]|nr:endonuclease/exonuclease/phosphatase family protein [Clostridia bacterium]
MPTLKVMSFNMRNDYSPDGINVFPNRKPRILEMLAREQPDLIGTQETTDNMRDFLRDELKGYTLYGCGREADYRGEHNLILLKNGRFEVVEMRNEALSFEPGRPGTTFGGDQSTCSRMYTYLRIKPSDGEVFQMVNTHLDHVGRQARKFGMAQILQHLSVRQEKWILTGDMNAFPDSEEIRMVTAIPGHPVTDCTDGLERTYHGYGTAPLHEGRIDYIFTDGICDPANSYAVPDPVTEGVYYSDHQAVCAFVTLP